MLDKFMEFSKKIFKHNKLIVAAGIIITIALAPGLFKLKMDNELINMISEKNQARIDVKKYQDVFGDSSLIFIGLEADNIYSKDVLEYINRLTPAIENLNSRIPEESIAKLFGVGKEKAGEIISLISEVSYMGKDEMMARLRDPQALSDEYFVDEDTAKIISEGAKRAGAEEIMNAYMLPLKEVRGILNTDFIKGKGDKFTVEKVYDGGGFDAANIERIKKRINSWDMYKGGIVSRDGKFTAILVQINPIGLTGIGKVHKKVNEIIAKTKKPAGVKVYIGGEPVINYQITQYMHNDMALLIPLVVIAVFLTLFLSFRNIGGVFLPMAAVGMAVTWSLGIMAYIGIPLNVVSTVMPVLLIAVGSAYGIHFMNFYYLDRTKNRMEAVSDNISGVGAAIMLAGITTFAGFGSLSTADFSLMRNFGIFTSLGVIFAILTSLYFIPSALLLSKKEKPVREVSGESAGFIEKLLAGISRYAVKHNKRIIAATVIVVALSVAGITMIKVEMNDVSLFKKGSEVRIVDAKLNEKLAGTQMLDLVLEKKDGSEILDPAVLSEVEKLKTSVEKKFDFVKKDFSLNEYLKKMNQEMYGGRKNEYKLPATKQKIRDYLLLYSGSLDSVISKKKDALRVTFVVNRITTTKMKELREYIYSLLQPDFLEKNNLKAVVTGYGNLNIVSNELIVSSQIRSLIISLIVIMIINFLVFRTAGVTGISLVPILTTVLMIFGLMGFLNISLNAGTAMVACVAIGTGIDYAIHFLVKFRRERKAGAEVDTAIDTTVMQTGRGILYNIFSVTAGFVVLALSKFTPLVQFGLLIAFSMVATGLGALLIIPSMLKTFKIKE